jgi:hypothetical protein
VVAFIFKHWAVGDGSDVIKKPVLPDIARHLVWASANPDTATDDPTLLAVGYLIFCPTLCQFVAARVADEYMYVELEAAGRVEDVIFKHCAVGDWPGVNDKPVLLGIARHLAWASANPVTENGDPILLVVG